MFFQSNLFLGNVLRISRQFLCIDYVPALLKCDSTSVGSL